jgi:hypothetical protein
MGITEPALDIREPLIMPASRITSMIMILGMITLGLLAVPKTAFTTARRLGLQRAPRPLSGALIPVRCPLILKGIWRLRGHLMARQAPEPAGGLLALGLVWLDLQLLAR